MNNIIKKALEDCDKWESMENSLFYTSKTDFKSFLLSKLLELEKKINEEHHEKLKNED